MKDPISEFAENLTLADLLDLYEKIFDDDANKTEPFLIYARLSDLFLRAGRVLAARSSRKDVAAFKELFLLASGFTKLYEGVLEEHKDLFRGHARPFESIPVSVSRSKTRNEKIKYLVGLSEVGDHIGLKSSGHRKGSLFAEVALELIQNVRNDQLAIKNWLRRDFLPLPPFSNEEEIIEKWWVAVSEKFTDVYGPDPENHSRFAEIRTSESYADTPATELDTRVRADIKKRLKQALSRLPENRDQGGKLLG